MRWLMDVAQVVMISGSICGLASFGWISVQTVQGYLRQRRILHALAIEARVMGAFRLAAAVIPSREHPALLRAHAEALTDRELMALKSIGSMLFRKASDARRVALTKGERRGST